MNENCWTHLWDRRAFLTTVASVATISISGCNETTADQIPKENTGTASRAQLPEDVRIAREKIRMAYRELGDHPLAENDRFVFDVTSFQNKFDRRETLERTKTAQKLLRESKNSSEAPEDVVLKLETSAVVVELQMKQRVQVFRTIQTGSMYLEILGEPNYETATKVIGKARTFLADVASLGERLEVQLEPIEFDMVERYDYERFQRAQKILAEVVLWLDPIYEGAEHFARAMQLVQLATSQIESGDFGIASQRFDEANTYLGRAQNEFDEAQGLGRTLPRFEQFLADVRCILPIHIRFTEELAKASKKLDSGNEEQARQMVRETLTRYQIQSSRCTEGDL